MKERLFKYTGPPALTRGDYGVRIEGGHNSQDDPGAIFTFDPDCGDQKICGIEAGLESGEWIEIVPSGTNTASEMIVKLAKVISQAAIVYDSYKSYTKGEHGLAIAVAIHNAAISIGFDEGESTQLAVLLGLQLDWNDLNDLVEWANDVLSTGGKENAATYNYAVKLIAPM